MGAVRNNAAKPNGTVKYALIGIFSGFFLSVYGKVNCKGSKVLPSFTLIGAGTDIIYIELFELAPIKLTLSFSSAPWMLRNRILTSKEFLIHLFGSAGVIGNPLGLLMKA
ncbi:hypothetical protein P8452_58183 [Trifolium repens]|nr:hypothetical protein P8452_58183 [Trifolium repens]